MPIDTQTDSYALNDDYMNPNDPYTGNTDNTDMHADDELYDCAAATPVMQTLTPVRIAAPSLTAKASMLKTLSEAVPLNSLGLPTYIYRADLLPADLNDGYMSAEDRAAYLSNAILELDYTQGFPTLQQGDPFWAQLPYEPANAYRAFVAYMDLPRATHLRSAHKDKTGKYEMHPLHNIPTTPIRQLHIVKQALPMEADNLLSYYHMFCWAPRIKAFEYFYAAEHEKRKQQRLRHLEDDHYDKATNFVETCTNAINDIFSDPDKLEAMKPKDLFDFTLKMMQMQRVAVGTTSFGAGSVPQQTITAPSASMEVTLRTIAEQSGANTEMKTVSNEDPTKMLLRDPDALAQAQELIIKMQTNANPRVNPHSGAEALRLEGGAEQFIK